ncbi:MAG: HlyD family efflux transporter periplasmic adaptor subunit [Vibrio sp.]|uniref:HlyD family efflux transporter periplasmic adaptor subunit n=1 Tax=Vibrio sp. TaxID=678 RepID=UPI003A83D3F1
MNQSNLDDLQSARLPSSWWVIWGSVLLFTAFYFWASSYKLDEVTTGQGTVIPSAREQIIQSLEGGILSELRVHEGDIVERGQELAQLDRTKTESVVEEAQSRLNAAMAKVARLNAEVNHTELVFPEEIANHQELIEHESYLFQSRKKSLNETVKGLEQGVCLIEEELAMTIPLVKRGAASNVEVLRLKRQKNELENKKNEVVNQYYVNGREELTKANEEIFAQRSIIRGRADSLTRLTIYSPSKAIVKEIDVTTMGGVIPPGGQLMSLVPIDDNILIEVKISPRDVAFIHPGQKAIVKITAYDYSIYGGLEGTVTMISPGTIRDEVRQEQHFYKVFVKTNVNYLKNKQQETFPIFPGMIAVVDIKTGSKTVIDYLIKPLNKAKEALRER